MAPTLRQRPLRNPWQRTSSELLKLFILSTQIDTPERAVANHDWRSAALRRDVSVLAAAGLKLLRPRRFAGRKNRIFNRTNLGLDTDVCCANELDYGPLRIC
jgi:hypothetical protein